jgi:hypothetical protein
LPLTPKHSIEKQANNNNQKLEEKHQTFSPHPHFLDLISTCPELNHIPGNTNSRKNEFLICDLSGSLVRCRQQQGCFKNWLKTLEICLPYFYFFKRKTNIPERDKDDAGHYFLFSSKFVIPYGKKKGPVHLGGK